MFRISPMMVSLVMVIAGFLQLVIRMRIVYPTSPYFSTTFSSFFFPAGAAPPPAPHRGRGPPQPPPPRIRPSPPAKHNILYNIPPPLSVHRCDLIFFPFDRDRFPFQTQIHGQQKNRSTSPTAAAPRPAFLLLHPTQSPPSRPPPPHHWVSRPFTPLHAGISPPL